MGRFILCVDDTINSEVWCQAAEYAYKEFGYKMCLAVDILRLNNQRIEELKKRVAEGHELCSHTTSHISLDKVEPQRVRYELVSSKAVLKSIFNIECCTIIYPFGGQNEKVVEMAVKVGYRYGRGVELRRFRTPSIKLNKMLISSINIPRDMGERWVDEAVNRWCIEADRQNWTVSLFSHGPEDFSFEDWKVLLSTIHKSTIDIKVVTFNEL